MGFFIIVFGSIFSAAISTNSAIDAVYETTTQPTDTQSSTLSGDILYDWQVLFSNIPYILYSREY